MSLLGLIVAGLAIAGLATVRFTQQKMSGLAAVQDKTMGQLEDIANAFDASTTAIGIELEDLKGSLLAKSTAGQSPDPATIARLQNIADRLKAMSATTVASTVLDVGTAPSIGTPTAAAPAAQAAPTPQPTTTQNVVAPSAFAASPAIPAGPAPPLDTSVTTPALPAVPTK